MTADSPMAMVLADPSLSVTVSGAALMAGDGMLTTVSPVFGHGRHTGQRFARAEPVAQISDIIQHFAAAVCESTALRCRA